MAVQFLPVRWARWLGCACRSQLDPAEVQDDLSSQKLVLHRPDHRERY